MGGGVLRWTAAGGGAHSISTWTGVVKLCPWQGSDFVLVIIEFQDNGSSLLIVIGRVVHLIRQAEHRLPGENRVLSKAVCLNVFLTLTFFTVFFGVFGFEPKKKREKQKRKPDERWKMKVKESFDQLLRFRLELFFSNQ